MNATPLFERVGRQIRVYEELIDARLQVDMPGIVHGVRARLESQLRLTPTVIEHELAERRGPLGWGRVTTAVWRAPGMRKISLSAVDMRPVVEGLALVILPDLDKAAPIFACDLMALPTRLSIHLDLYGGAQIRPLLDGGLASLDESFARLGGHKATTWSAHLQSGHGLHARVSLRAIDDCCTALNAGLSRAVEIINSSPAGDGSVWQKRFFETFHAHGPRTGPLGRMFGGAFAERYSRLLFE